MKKCSTCGKTENEVKFHSKSNRCKDCHRIYMRKWNRKKNKVQNPQKQYSDTPLNRLKVKLQCTNIELADKLGTHSSVISLVLNQKKELSELQNALIGEMLNEN